MIMPLIVILKQGTKKKAKTNQPKIRMEKSAFDMGVADDAYDEMEDFL